MTEPMEPPVVVTSDQCVALTLVCPGCGASVALFGRLELTADRRAGGPFCVCERCGTSAYLALRSA